MNTLEFVVIAIAIIFLLLSNLHNIYKQNKQIALTNKLRKDVKLLLMDRGFRVDCSLEQTIAFKVCMKLRDMRKERDSKLCALDQQFAKEWIDTLNDKPCCEPAYKPTDGIADPNANKPTDDIKAKQNEAINGQKYSKGFTVHADKPGLQLGRVIPFKDLPNNVQDWFVGVTPETVTISALYPSDITLSYTDAKVGMKYNVTFSIENMKPFYHLKARKTKPE